MNRRSFLRGLVAGVAGVAAAELDPERLLWVPGAKTFFLPSVEPVQLYDEWEQREFIVTATDMDGNPFITPDVVAREALHILKGNLGFAKRVNREFEQGFFKVGDRLTIQMPKRYEVRP